MFAKPEYWNDNWYFFHPNIIKDYGIEYFAAIEKEFNRLADDCDNENCHNCKAHCNNNVRFCHTDI
jgi:hypothetical protein